MGSSPIQGVQKLILSLKLESLIIGFIFYNMILVYWKNKINQLFSEMFSKQRIKKVADA